MELEARNLKFAGGRAVARIEAMHAVVRSQPKAFDGAMRDLKQRRQVGIITVSQQLAIAWDQIDKPFEGCLDRGQILEDIRVIEFEVVDDDYFRKVMDKFAPLVEKGGVVFVPLDDEPWTFREARAFAEIIGNAADEKARLQPVMLEHPRQQRGGGGLAVRTTDHERTFAANEEFLQQFRQRAITHFLVQHSLRLRIPARN